MKEDSGNQKQQMQQENSEQSTPVGFIVPNTHKQVASRHWYIPFIIGITCAIILYLASSSRVMKSLEYLTYDWRVSSRHLPAFANIQAPTHFRNPNVVVVTIDNDSLMEVDDLKKPMVLWTRNFTEIYEALLANDVRVIGQDYLFMVSSDEFLQEEMSIFVEKLAKSGMIKGDPVNASQFFPRYDLPYFMVLRSATNPENTCESRIVLISGMGADGSISLPFERFSRAVTHDNVALATPNPDEDGINRRSFLYKNAKTEYIASEIFYSLDLVCASRYFKKPIELDKKLNQIKIGDILLPKTDNDYTVPINFVGPPGTFLESYTTREGVTIPRYNFKELLLKARTGDNEYFRKNFAGKAVLFGPGFIGSGDLALTPYSAFRYLDMYGIEVHANFLNTIINRDFLYQAPAWVLVTIIFLTGILAASLAYYLRPLPSLLLMVAGALLFTGVSLYSFYHNNLVLSMAPPLLVMPLGYAITYVYRYMVEDKEKRFIRKVLGRYISEQVAQEILKDPAKLALGGKRADVSVLFCDINDFTTYSEKTPPEEVISILNDYFTRMEKVIFQNRGTLKQFVGDEIMVVCSAPQLDPDHAIRICTIAVEMVDELKRWQEERKQAGKFVFDVKFGIHSGEVVAGNVGSPNRTEYTTIGDVVNTTSRIMGLTKEANARILISEETYRRVQGKFEVIDKGSFPVKGRQEEVRVYELISKKS